jgi:CheY-like chemotaxis protein
MQDKYNFSTFSVLIIEDNRFVRQIVRELCRSFGFGGIADVDNVEAGLKYLQSDHFDMAICDWEMQPLDGNEFVRRVRGMTESEHRYLPIIMLTAHTEIARITAARDHGNTEYLAKPISAKTLLTRICSIVDHPRPFIETSTYFGPDRRRHKDSDYEGGERRGTPRSVLAEDARPKNSTAARNLALPQLSTTN